MDDREIEALIDERIDRQRLQDLKIDTNLVGRHCWYSGRKHEIVTVGHVRVAELVGLQICMADLESGQLIEVQGIELIALNRDGLGE